MWKLKTVPVPLLTAVPKAVAFTVTVSGAASHPDHSLFDMRFMQNCDLGGRDAHNMVGIGGQTFGGICLSVVRN